MFYKASKFDSNITQWDVSKVKDTQYVSICAPVSPPLTAAPDALRSLPLHSCRYMFRDAESFSVDISQWDMSKVADMRYVSMRPHLSSAHRST